MFFLSTRTVSASQLYLALLAIHCMVESSDSVLIGMQRLFYLKFFGYCLKLL